MPDSIFHFPRQANELRADAHFGVARFSGFWTQVDYTQSYARAAELLFENAKRDLQLDEIAVPLFFLQRHTVELALKDFISVAAALLDEQEPDLAIKAEKLSLSTHALAPLRAKAAELLSKIGAGELPQQVDSLIQHFESFEQGAVERARFASVKTKGEVARSLPQGDISDDLVIDTEPKVILPLGHIMVLIRELVDIMRLDQEDQVFSKICYLLNDKINHEVQRDEAEP